MSTLLSFLILFIPIIYQFKIGNKSLFENNLKKFFINCLISFGLQIVTSFISFLLAIQTISNAENKCELGQLEFRD